MIDTSDVLFFLIGFVVGGGVMRWLAWRWYALPALPHDYVPDPPVSDAEYQRAMDAYRRRSVKARVDGLEMFGTAHRPGTAVCDGCGHSVSWDKYSRDEMEEALRGWSRDGDNIGAGVVCPGCVGNNQQGKGK